VFTDKELIIAIPAFAGMLLGLYNFVRDLLRNRVSLRVIPKSVAAISRDPYRATVYKYSPDHFDPEEQPTYVAIEIVNRGAVTVTVDTVGYIVKGKGAPLQIDQPQPVDKGSWPRRLEPRESVTVTGSLPDLLSSKKCSKITSAFVSTQCGIVRKGSSESLRQLVEYASRELNA
jgi:hypothetical protein